MTALNTVLSTSMKYAVCISDQGVNAPVDVFGFILQPEEKLHVWKGKFATTPKELCEHVNEAIVQINSIGNPFVTLRVVELDAEWKDTTRESLIAANEELLRVIERGPTRIAA